jgi:hypothetical protein
MLTTALRVVSRQSFFHCPKELLFGNVHVEQVFICIVLGTIASYRRRVLGDEGVSQVDFSSDGGTS